LQFLLAVPSDVPKPRQAFFGSPPITSNYSARASQQLCAMSARSSSTAKLCPFD